MYCLQKLVEWMNKIKMAVRIPPFLPEETYLFLVTGFLATVFVAGLAAGFLAADLLVAILSP